MGEIDVSFGNAYRPLMAGTQTGRFILVEGPRGTGKTRAILSHLVIQALKYPGSRWLIARSRRVRLAETVLVTFREQVLPAFGLPAPTTTNEGMTRYEFPNGSCFIIMGLDDPQRTQSAEIAGGYVSEAVEIESRDAVVSLAGAMRQDVPGLPYHQMIVDCNPGAPGHWLNQIAEPVSDELRMVNTPAEYKRMLAHNVAPPPPGKWKRMITRVMDNPHFFDVKLWQWTVAGARYVQETLAELSGWLKDRWLHGLWVAQEGVVYSEFSALVHVCNPFDVPEAWPQYVFYDPGYDHPAAVLWYAIDPKGILYVIDEIYGSHIPLVTVHDEAGKEIKLGIIDLIKQRSKGRNVLAYYGDPHKVTAQTQEASGVSIQDQFEEEGITLETWPAGESEGQVEALRKRLIRRTYFVFATCTWHIMEFQSWRYKRNAKGEQLSGDDQYEDRNNHTLDIARGAEAAGIADTRPKVTVSTEPRTIRPGLDDVDWERERGPAGRPMAARAKANRVAVGMV